MFSPAVLSIAPCGLPIFRSQYLHVVAPAAPNIHSSFPVHIVMPVKSYFGENAGMYSGFHENCYNSCPSIAVDEDQGDDNENEDSQFEFVDAGDDSSENDVQVFNDFEHRRPQEEVDEADNGEGANIENDEEENEEDEDSTLSYNERNDARDEEEVYNVDEDPTWFLKRTLGLL
jgi:hypothetical protein